MPTLRKLPARLKKLVHDLSLLRQAMSRFEEHLGLAHEAAESCPALSKAEVAPLTEHLDAAHNHLRGLLAAQGVSALAQAREHFARHGLEPGATVALDYPVYGTRLDAAFDDTRVPPRTRRVVLKVAAFTVEHVRSRTEVVLGVQGLVVADGKATKESASFPLHPGCDFEVLKAAPAVRQAAAADAPVPEDS